MPLAGFGVSWNVLQDFDLCGFIQVTKNILYEKVGGIIDYVVYIIYGGI